MFSCRLKQAGEVGDLFELEELLAGWGGGDHLVLQDPGAVVGDEDGVQAGGEGGVDVGLGRVADHPGGGGVEGVAGDELTVGRGVLFREDLHGREEGAEARALQLVGLLFKIALGDHNAAMSLAELGEGGVDLREEVDLRGGDGVCERDDARVVFWRDGLVA